MTARARAASIAERVRAKLVAGLLLLMACGGSEPTDPLPRITGLSITGPDSVMVGQSISLGVVIQASGAVSTGTSWSSSNGTVATVDGSGIVKGISRGSVIITAAATADPSVSATKSIAVVAPTVTTVVTGPDTVGAGLTIQLTAAVSSTGGTVSQAVTWTSGSLSVATVSSTGLVKGVSAGTAVITVRSQADSSSSGSHTVTVTPPAVTVAITGPATVTAGGTVQLASTVSSTAGDVSQAVTWATTNPGVATVSSTGVVAGVSAGTAVIVATSQADASARATHTVTVTAATVVTVAITGPATVMVGRAVQLAAAVTSTAGTVSQAVTWKSSDTGVATVSSQGIVVGVAPGSSTITATSGADPTATASVTVAVAAPPAAALIHQWTFSESGGAGTQLRDAVGTAHAQIVDAGASDATVGTGRVTLQGGARDAADYVLLPSTILSGVTDVTIELWATQHGLKNWGRIFDFGTSQQDYLTMTWTWVSDLNRDRVEWVHNGALALRQDGGMAPYTLGAEHHIVFTLATGAGPTGKNLVRVYKDGELRASVETEAALTGAWTNHYLGRSQWTVDETAHASFNELRIYSGALTGAEVVTSFAQGPVQDNAPPPATVTVSVTGPDSVAVGQSIELTGAVSSTSGEISQALTWSSSNTAVARVAANGLVTGVSAGTVTITAKSAVASSASGTRTVTVKAVAPVVTSVSVGGLNAVLVAGTVQLAAVVTSSPGSVSQAVTWSSSNSSVAGVSSAGVVTGVAPGTATIIAASVVDPSVRGSFEVTVSAPVVTVQVTGADRVLVGDSTDLSATVTSTGGSVSQAVSWTSNQLNVATVSNTGRVRGISRGIATITARSTVDASALAQFVLTVHQPSTSAEIVLSGPTEVEAGRIRRLEAEVVSDDTTFSQEVTWSSSDTTTAIMSDAGQIKALWVGRVTVTATSVQDPQIKASRTVTIIPATDPEGSVGALSAADLFGDLMALKRSYAIQEWDGMDMPWLYGYARGLEGHIQGIARVGQRWVMSHSMSEGAGLLIHGTGNGKWTFEAGLDLGTHPGGIQAAGNVFAVPFKGDTTGVKFFQFLDDGTLVERLHLRIPTSFGEAGALAFNRNDGRFYFIESSCTSYCTNDGSLALWRTTLPGQSLTVAANQFEKVTLPPGFTMPRMAEGSNQLVYDDATRQMYLVTLSRVEGSDAVLQNTHRIDIASLDLRTFTSAYRGQRTDFDRTDNVVLDPSFRMGSGIFLSAAGQVSIIATERCTSFQFDPVLQTVNVPPCDPVQDKVEYFILSR